MKNPFPLSLLFHLRDYSTFTMTTATQRAQYHNNTFTHCSNQVVTSIPSTPTSSAPSASSPHASDSTPSRPVKSHAAAIGGGVAGAFLLLLILLLAIWFLRRKKRSNAVDRSPGGTQIQSRPAVHHSIAPFTSLDSRKYFDNILR
jgi:hypothetical protein